MTIINVKSHFRDGAMMALHHESMRSIMLNDDKEKSNPFPLDSHHGKELFFLYTCCRIACTKQGGRVLGRVRR
jgi:hypothetical protein